MGEATYVVDAFREARVYVPQDIGDHALGRGVVDKVDGRRVDEGEGELLLLVAVCGGHVDVDGDGAHEGGVALQVLSFLHLSPL